MSNMTFKNKLATGLVGISMIGAGVLANVLPAGAQPAGGSGSLFDSINTNATATATGAGVKGQVTDLPTLVGSIIKGALGLLGLILVVLIIYAGWLWMSSQGDEEKIGKAKGIILNAVIGMAIIFAAYAITNFVLTSIIKNAV